MVRFLALLALFCMPLSASAAISITEIMYDLEGSDSGREWVEIYNDGSEDIDLADWRFYEQDTNHKLKNENSTTLSAGEYALIVQDPAVFQSDNPDVSGLILDSSFSLRSQGGVGEYIAIKNPNGEEVDALTYTPQSSADGEGDSLQLVDGSWIAASPTPASPNANENSSSDTGNTSDDKEEESTNNSDGSEANADSNTHPVDSTKPIVERPQIYADAGGDRTVIAGADVSFEGIAYGAEGELIDPENARFTWNFGDGRTAEGQNRLHHFRYPGTYIVALSVASGDNSATDYIKVKAEPSQILIHETGAGDAGPYITLKNDSSRDIHLGGWHLKAGNQTFTFPEQSYIAAGETLRLPKELTHLSLAEPFILLYPNGNLAHAYDSKPKQKEVKPAPQPRPQKQVQGASASAAPHPNEKEKKQEENRGALEQKEMAATSSSSNQAALIVGGAEERGSPLLLWILALLGVTLLVVGGVVYITLTERKGARGAAEEYTIIEDESDEIK